MLVLVLIAITRYWRGEQPLSAPTDLPATGMHRVVRVVDGDTLIVAPHDIVRLIGVDTPETVKPNHPVEPLGPEASAFTREFVSGGSVRLSFDRERVDRFGRFLAYVWVGDKLLNEELLRAGLARWERNFNYSSEMKRRFRQAEAEAKDAGRGIWSGQLAPRQSQLIRTPRAFWIILSAVVTRSHSLPRNGEAPWTGFPTFDRRRPAACARAYGSSRIAWRFSPSA